MLSQSVLRGTLGSYPPVSWGSGRQSSSTGGRRLPCPPRCFPSSQHEAPESVQSISVARWLTWPHEFGKTVVKAKIKRIFLLWVSSERGGAGDPCRQGASWQPCLFGSPTPKRCLLYGGAELQASRAVKKSTKGDMKGQQPDKHGLWGDKRSADTDRKQGVGPSPSEGVAA